MAVFHTRLNVPPWGPCASLAALDSALEAAGSRPVELDWTGLPLEDDGEHFPWTGLCGFADRLGDAVRRTILLRPELRVVTDSTVGHHHEAGTRLVEQVLSRTFKRVDVDAVCGSGFAAMAREGQHAHARLSRWLRTAPPPSDTTAVLFILGWNDTARPDTTVSAAARACVALARRWLEG